MAMFTNFKDSFEKGLYESEKEVESIVTITYEKDIRYSSATRLFHCSRRRSIYQVTLILQTPTLIHFKLLISYKHTYQ